MITKRKAENMVKAGKGYYVFGYRNSSFNGAFKPVSREIEKARKKLEAVRIANPGNEFEIATAVFYKVEGIRHLTDERGNFRQSREMLTTYVEVE